MSKIVEKIKGTSGAVLFEEDTQKLELDVLDEKIDVPMKLSGAEIKKTIRGWKAKCGRCGVWIGFDKNTIETSGPANKLSLLKEAAIGYMIGRDQNKLVDDFESNKIDFVEFLRSERGLIYKSGRYPNALSGRTSINLTCEECGGNTTVNVDVGEEFEIRKLPTDVQALIRLGIWKKDSVQFFQLRTGKLAEKFVEAIKFSQEEIEQLQDYKEKIGAFCNKLKTESRIVSELLYDTMSAARSSATEKIRQLEEWQKASVLDIERSMFPFPTGGD